MALISKTYSKILVILMAWLGFSCSKGNNSDNPEIPFPFGPDEYGTPYAIFKAKGAVASQTNDAPIEGIRVVLKTPFGEDKFRGLDTVYTDSKGVFNLKSRESVFRKLYVELSDIDGDENGLFNDKDIEADYSKETFTGGDDRWYRGEVEKDLGTIKMEPKE